MPLKVDDRPGGIRVLTLSNPGKKNALDASLLEALREALAPKHLRALLVTGEGKTFCSGYDLEQLPVPQAHQPLPDALLGEVLSLLERHPAPSVALVTGPAFGAGCELAATCDFRVGSDAALFCMPPARLGIVYAPDGLWRLARLVGLAKAKLMFLTGRRVDAKLASGWGLLDELHPHADAEQRALSLCEELAGNAPLAVRGMKRGFELLAAAQLERGAREELERLRREAFGSDDAKEGRAAFLEKRAPAFKGR